MSVFFASSVGLVVYTAQTKRLLSVSDSRSISRFTGRTIRRVWPASTAGSAMPLTFSWAITTASAASAVMPSLSCSSGRLVTTLAFRPIIAPDASVITLTAPPMTVVSAYICWKT